MFRFEKATQTPETSIDPTVTFFGKHL